MRNLARIQRGASEPRVRQGLYRVILIGMKTAISVPQETFEKVEQRAAALGVSRSEFYAQAASRYLDELEAQDLPGQINTALALAGDDESNAVAADAGRRRIAALSGEW